MSLILQLLAVAAAILLACYHWSRRHLYLIGYKLEGPPALPIIGNGLLFMGDIEGVLDTITKLTTKFTSPVRIWFGLQLVVVFSKPHQIEKILTSSKVAIKHDLYKLLQKYLGDGFVSSLGGEKYKHQKKIFQPLFNINFVNNNIDLYQKHIDILLKKLENHLDGKTFDIEYAMHNCFADIIGDTVYGQFLNAQYGFNHQFLKATSDIYDVGYNRLIKPWFHSDFVFKYLSGFQKQENSIIEVTRTYTKNAIEAARQRIKSIKIEDADHIPVVDAVAKYIDENPSCMSDEDFLYNLLTVYLASEDTATIIISMFCVCMGMYPEYQKKLVEEIHSNIGKSTNKNITYEDLNRLPYLDMCYREVLRLMPIAPLLARQPKESFTIDNLTIPKRCAVVVSSFTVHRDPEFWQNPLHFHPDHFLPEFTKTRHPYAFIPFSGGTRACQGKIIANGMIKLAIINILQRFEIMADGKFTEIKLKCDISVRPANGYKLRLKARK